MIRALIPDRLEESVYTMDFEAEYRNGVRGLVFDIDNTLVPHDAPADPRSIELFLRLRKIGFRTAILSNNHEPRVRSFSEEVGADVYIMEAGKPKRGGYYRVMEALGTDLSNTLYLGDQILTDICGAKRAGMKHVLFRPIDRIHEPFHIHLKRIVELPFILIAKEKQKRPKRA